MASTKSNEELVWSTRWRSKCRRMHGKTWCGPVGQPMKRLPQAQATANRRQKLALPPKACFRPTASDMLQQLATYGGPLTGSDGGLERIDAHRLRGHLAILRGRTLDSSGAKRVILSNLNELVAAQLEVFGMTKHAILMRKRPPGVRNPALEIALPYPISFQ